MIFYLTLIAHFVCFMQSLKTVTIKSYSPCQKPFVQFLNVNLNICQGFNFSQMVSVSGICSIMKNMSWIVPPFRERFRIIYSQSNYKSPFSKCFRTTSRRKSLIWKQWPLIWNLLHSVFKFEMSIGTLIEIECYSFLYELLKIIF